jgi:hypothetical protein
MELVLDPGLLFFCYWLWFLFWHLTGLAGIPIGTTDAET